MTPMLEATRSTLILLAFIGVYSIWYLFFANGAAEHLAHILESKDPLLPETKEPLKTTFTGFAALDYQLKALTLYFWTQVDGSRPNSALLCFYFAGQVTAGWGLFLIEALRPGNHWRVVSFITIWGVLGQNLAFGVVMPTYLAIHLSTSSTILSRKPSDFYVAIPKLASIPFSLALGFVLPTVLVALPAPSIWTHDRKQVIIAIWQPFPIWVELVRQIATFVISSLGRTEGGASGIKQQPDKQWLKVMRAVYTFLLATAGVTHISTKALMASSKFFPGLFASEFIGILNPSKVFLPQAITASTKVSSLGDGAFLLLQYDFIVGSAAIALWASALYITTYRSLKKSNDWMMSAVIFISQLVLLGPIGHAVACIWSRDELVFEERTEEFSKSH